MTFRIHEREIDGILFDVDGTLYGLEDQKRIFDSIQRTLAISLLQLTGQQAPDATAIETTKEKYVARAHEVGSWTAAFVEFGGKKENYQLIAGHADRSRYLGYNPKLRQLLENIHGQAKLGVLTSAPTEVTSNTCSKLLGHRWEDLFDIIICEDTPDLPAQKPDAAAFRFAAQGLGANLDRVAMVGDIVKADILPARTLGMMTIFVGENQNGPQKEIWDLKLNGVEELEYFIKS